MTHFKMARAMKMNSRNDRILSGFLFLAVVMTAVMLVWSAIDAIEIVTAK